MIQNSLSSELAEDIRNISQIGAIPSILNVICKSTGMGFAAIARVTDTEWITCMAKDEINFGLKPGDPLSLETTICNEIRQHHNPVVIEEVSCDLQYNNHHTPMKYGFQSYISFPIFRKNGQFFGTLCAIDPAPAKIANQETRELFQLYTELIAFHLDAVEELVILNDSLKEEKHISELRETFIAILGHDLRNPVGTTRMCADILMKMDLPEMALRQANTIKSTSYRMQTLIDNLLDFAKGHLGDGIKLDLSTNIQALKKALNQVTREIRVINTDQDIKTHIRLNEGISCDANRIAQLYSNLLSNAVKHGKEGAPILVEINCSEGVFELSVTNLGEAISLEKQQNLFKPFFTTNASNNKSGLGLGLYISSEIAKAHSGKIDIHSDEEKTSFIFSMPYQVILD